MTNRLKGTGVALITPFLKNGQIDFAALEKLVEDEIQNGIDYLVALGTTSESPALSQKEKEEVVRTVVAVNAGRVAVLRGLGGPNTLELVEQLHTLDFTGVDAILSVTPYYNRPSQEGVYRHYHTLSDHSPLPIILYNVPKRTGCNIEADTTLRLANDCPNIIAVKEASGNLNQIMRIVKHKPAEFSVISGDDAITLPLIAAGADGLISVVANAFPKEVSTMVRLARQDKIAEARAIHLALLDFTQACFKEGSPAGIKALMWLQGKIQNQLRLPQAPVSETLVEKFKLLLEDRQ
ncbi:MAG: 4-hydroxy-tetrahydrodipicolinate synthase [Bacteroidales bacterium]|nr:4-hydroxy-tetrahydrodipicolinate synthase [Bacteroidales bacterium]